MKEPGTHKLTEALEGQTPPAEAGGPNGPAEPRGHGSTPQEVAEDARRSGQARPEATPDRDDKLTEIGRGQQTHG